MGWDGMRWDGIGGDEVGIDTRVAEEVGRELGRRYEECITVSNLSR